VQKSGAIWTPAANAFVSGAKPYTLDASALINTSTKEVFVDKNTPAEKAI